jgi:Protein of unknown function (DUF4242)
MTMPKYLVERNVKGAGDLTTHDLQGLSQVSRGVIDDMSGQVQWLESFVTQDKIYCVYISPNADLVREHARRGGFPADVISEVRAIIDPSTAEYPWQRLR